MRCEPSPLQYAADARDRFHVSQREELSTSGPRAQQLLPAVGLHCLQPKERWSGGRVPAAAAAALSTARSDRTTEKSDGDARSSPLCQPFDSVPRWVHSGCCWSCDIVKWLSCCCLTRFGHLFALPVLLCFALAVLLALLWLSCLLACSLVLLLYASGDGTCASLLACMRLFGWLDAVKRACFDNGCAMENPHRSRVSQTRKSGQHRKRL